eukprot:9246862-Lingulodinium_polyedra.AAC.1
MSPRNVHAAAACVRAGLEINMDGILHGLRPRHGLLGMDIVEAKARDHEAAEPQEKRREEDLRDVPMDLVEDRPVANGTHLNELVGSNAL